MSLHQDLTDEYLHTPGYVQSGDPGAVGAGILWIDTSGGTGAWVNKIRNAGDTGWENVSGAGGGVTDYDDLTSYKDLVTLQQSGAGLPSHDGAEAALYDGDGNQILGRTAQRHWLDPHPDAVSFDETYEFSTKGDMTQGELESDGWTFSGYTASVTSGVMRLVNTGGEKTDKASIACSLTGDFDLVFVPLPSSGYDAFYAESNTVGCFGVGDTVNDVVHAAMIHATNGATQRVYSYINGTWSAAAGTAANSSMYVGTPLAVRISRVSGTVYLGGGNLNLGCLKEDDVSANYGWKFAGSVGDADTFDKIYIAAGQADADAGGVIDVLFLRRFQ